MFVAGETVVYVYKVADAVVYNFNRFLDEELPRGHVVRDIAGITGISKVNDFTVEFKTEQPQAFFTKMLAHQHAVMASPTALKALGEETSSDH